MRQIVVKKIAMTCSICPFQLEGVTSDRRPIYVRARHEELSIRIGPAGGDITSAVQGAEIFQKEPTDPEDETWPGLKRLTRGLIRWPARLARRSPLV